MKKESNEENNMINLTEEEFFKMLEKHRSLNNSSFEDPALQKFVKEPSEPHSNNKESILTNFGFFLLLFLFLVILISSIIGKIRGTMEAYITIPIAILSYFGLIILIIDRIITKKSK